MRTLTLLDSSASSSRLQLWKDSLSYVPSSVKMGLEGAESLPAGSEENWLCWQRTNGMLRPVAYASRAMTPTEQRYSQIEKEALATTWSLKRFNDYLYGMSFNVETDHKPRVSLLSSKKNLDELSPRIHVGEFVYRNR